MYIFISHKHIEMYSACHTYEYIEKVSCNSLNPFLMWPKCFMYEYVLIIDRAKEQRKNRKMCVFFFCIRNVEIGETAEKNALWSVGKGQWILFGDSSLTPLRIRITFFLITYCRFIRFYYALEFWRNSRLLFIYTFFERVSVWFCWHSE